MLRGGDLRVGGRRALRVLLAFCIAVTLPLGSLPFARDDARSPVTGDAVAADGWHFGQDRDALLSELPAGPAPAALELVHLIYDEDFEVAVFATMDLLRRAGLPLVNLDNRVAALPDV